MTMTQFDPIYWDIGVSALWRGLFCFGQKFDRAQGGIAIRWWWGGGAGWNWIQWSVTLYISRMTSKGAPRRVTLHEIDAVADTRLRCLEIEVMPTAAC